jgi:hypothetical protein
MRGSRREMRARFLLQLTDDLAESNEEQRLGFLSWPSNLGPWPSNLGGTNEAVETIEVHEGVSIRDEHSVCGDVTREFQVFTAPEMLDEPSKVTDLDASTTELIGDADRDEIAEAVHARTLRSFASLAH